MKRIYLILKILCLPFLSVGQQFVQLSASEFNTAISHREGTLLDVRTPQEFNQEHIEGAGNLNFYALDFYKQLELLPRDEPVYLYCKTGWRSTKAADYLMKHNYTKVYNLKKGLMEWDLNELPLIQIAELQSKGANSYRYADFRRITESEDRLVMIDFYAPWCAPCRKMLPFVDKIEKEYSGQVAVIKINVDASKALVKKLQIGSVPYFVFYKNNVPVDSFLGERKEQEIRQIVNNLLQKENKL